MQDAGVSYAAAACSPVLKAPKDFTGDEVKREHPLLTHWDMVLQHQEPQLLHTDPRLD